MILGLVSDSHDNAAGAAAAAVFFKDRAVGFVIHAGDVVTPATLDPFRGMDGVAIIGNNDDAQALTGYAHDMGWTTAHAWTHVFDGIRVGATHGNDKGRIRDLMARDPPLDVLVVGHSHTERDETVQGVRVINPGALHRARTYTVSVFDTMTGLRERHVIPH